MFHDDGYALLIGIDDYRAFDRSTGQPEGTSSLHGSVLDAHVLFRLCTQLGMKPENIRVVTSPPADPTMFPGADPASFGDASEEGIRAAVGWLADKLGGGRAGLLTYSGHGAHLCNAGLLMCPSDTAGAGFEHAIPFEDLRALLGGAATNLTVVLDCCHGGAFAADPRGRRPTTLGGDAVARGERRDEMMIGARVLAACQPGEMTQQASFGGRWHGAFSWALGAVVDQWRAVDQGGNVRMDLSYGTLLEKARQLLAVLDFPGTPALYGPSGVEWLAVLQVGRRSEGTCARPDGQRAGVQLDSGMRSYRVYTLTASDGAGNRTQVASVLATGSYPPSSDYASNTEYYWISSDIPGAATTITITAEDGGALPAGRYDQRWGENITWSIKSGAPRSSQSLFVYTSASLEFGLDWTISVKNGYRGSVAWFTNTDATLLFGGLDRIDFAATNNTEAPSDLVYKKGVTWT